MSILIGFLFFSTIITMIAAFGLDQEIGIVIVTGASVLLFIIILICIGSFILTVSDLSHLFLSVLYFYYFAVDFGQTCF
jgi:hypothetical protein